MYELAFAASVDRGLVRENNEDVARVFGASDQVVVDTALHRCEPGDVFVLCSDGPWGGVKEDKLAQLDDISVSASSPHTAELGARPSSPP